MGWQCKLDCVVVIGFWIDNSLCFQSLMEFIGGGCHGFRLNNNIKLRMLYISIIFVDPQPELVSSCSIWCDDVWEGKILHLSKGSWRMQNKVLDGFVEFWTNMISTGDVVPSPDIFKVILVHL